MTITITDTNYRIHLRGKKGEICTIQSNLREDGDRDYNMAIDGIESLVLALYANGFDMSNPRMISSLSDAINACANNI